MTNDNFIAVTSFGPAGWELYGRSFVNSYLNYWPPRVKLIVYIEKEIPKDFPKSDRIEVRDLFGIGSCVEFLERHKHNADAQGRAQRYGWKTKDLAKGYCFRFDAYKFCRKVFVLEDMSKEYRHTMFWLDADIVTHKSVPMQLLHWVLPKDHHISYLDRGRYHSECGFMGYDLSQEETRAFLTKFAKTYSSDRVFAYKQWHDSFVFDVIRMHFKDRVKCYKIPHHSGTAPFDSSELGIFMTHFKGDRKEKRYAKSGTLVPA